MDNGFAYNILRARVLGCWAVWCLVCVLALAGCKGAPEEAELSAVASEAKEYYNQGVQYDQAWKMRLAEMYYRKAYELLRDDPTQQLWIYGDAGYRYAYLVSQRGDMETSLKVVSEIKSVAEAHKDFPLEQLAGVYLQVGMCQLRLGQGEEAKRSLVKAYETEARYVGGERKGVFNMIIMCGNAYNACLETGDYEEAAEWLRRGDEEFAAYERSEARKPELVEEYRAMQAIDRAILLVRTGRGREAAAVYASVSPRSMKYPMCLHSAAIYLTEAKRYAEAADLYLRLDSTFIVDSLHLTLEKIAESLGPRYRVYRLAGRDAEAQRLADSAFNAMDSAVVRKNRDDAAELAVIYQTHEKELALKESRAETRVHRVLLATAVVVILLAGWLLGRTHRYNHVLLVKNRRLYEQIRRSEQAEAAEHERQQAQPAETLSQNQIIYNRLCEVIKDPAVYTDSEANHETLARLAGTNRTYVYDALRECAGLTPADFINRHRIRHAALLLTTTDEPVGLIVEECGITNRSTFARLFREQYSMSPTEYRRAAKEK